MTTGPQTLWELLRHGSSSTAGLLANGMLAWNYGHPSLDRKAYLRMKVIEESRAKNCRRVLMKPFKPGSSLAGS